MSQMHVMQAYRGVVDDVIGHVRLDFQEEGIDEYVPRTRRKRRWKRTVDGKGRTWKRKRRNRTEERPRLTDQAKRSTLLELQTLWETKLMQSGALGEAFGVPKKEVIEHVKGETQGNVGVPKSALPPLGNTVTHRDGSGCEQQKGGGKRTADGEIGEGSSRKQVKVETQEDRYRSDEGKSADDSDDDGESLTSSEEEAEPETNNLTLAQFDRVHRSKNKYKCSLREGVMNIMGRDYLFSTATGDFDWS